MATDHKTVGGHPRQRWLVIIGGGTGARHLAKRVGAWKAAGQRGPFTLTQRHAYAYRGLYRTSEWLCAMHNKVIGPSHAQSALAHQRHMMDDKFS